MNFDLVTKPIVERMRRFGSTDGIAVTEYGMLIALVAVALIAVLTIFAPGISSWFAAKTGQITTV
jgi:Flp pilus assembly pilin Flp